MQPGELPTNFYAAGKWSDNFCQLSVRPGDLPSTFCVARAFRELPSTFHATRGPYVNFRQLSIWSGDLPSTFHATGKCSISVHFPCFRQNFHQLFLLSVGPGDLLSTFMNFLCGRETFIKISSSFCAAGRTSVNIPCVQKTFCNFQQLYVLLEDIVSTFVNFLCHRETFRQLSSTFLPVEKHSVNFRQLSVWPEELP